MASSSADNMLIEAICIKDFYLWKYFKSDLKANWSSVAEQLRRIHTNFPLNDYFEKFVSDIEKIEEIFYEWYRYNPKLIDLMVILVNIENFGLASDLLEFAQKLGIVEVEKWEIQNRRIRERRQLMEENRPTNKPTPVKRPPNLQPVPTLSNTVEFIYQAMQSCFTNSLFISLLKGTNNKQSSSVDSQQLIRCFLDICAHNLPLRTFFYENISSAFISWIQQHCNKTPSVVKFDSTIQILGCSPFPGVVIKNSIQIKNCILCEAVILQRLHHPNIVQLAGVLFSPKIELKPSDEIRKEIFSYINVHLVLYEFGNGDHLKNCLEKANWSIKRILQLIMQIVLAMQYLHYNYPYAIYHGNIKLEHVLVDEKWNLIQLCGFGRAGYIHYKDTQSTSQRNPLTTDIMDLANLIDEIIKIYEKRKINETQIKIFEDFKTLPNFIQSHCDLTHTFFELGRISKG